MKKELLEEALDMVQDEYLAEAAACKKRRFLPWVGSVAAVLALLIGLQFLQVPVALQAQAVILAEAPRVDAMPQPEDYPDSAQYQAAMAQWQQTERLRDLLTTETVAQMTSFTFESMRVFLSGQEGNQVYSPANAYLGLAMTAELTAGQTRQQLLAALGTDDLEALRSQASALWENIFLTSSREVTYIQTPNDDTSCGPTYVYRNVNHEVSTLANSLWLDETLDYSHQTMAALARYYYASVYQQDLSDPQAVDTIRSWLDAYTGSLLSDATGNLTLPEEAQMILYSTVYFRSRWVDEFHSGNNTEGTFHGASGDSTVTFMNNLLCQTYCYFGDSFCAVALELNNGSRMWFLLPNPGQTVEDILNDPQYLELVTAPGSQWPSKKYASVNLSVPKFDIQTTADLRQGLEAMGITHLFDPVQADFSASLNTPAYISAANQTIRVTVDESGVTAFAYLELQSPGSPQPSKEIIDFILDRPFLFVIEKNQIPLFTGVIRQP